jgi:hypothetical protein
VVKTYFELTHPALVKAMVIGDLMTLQVLVNYG